MTQEFNLTRVFLLLRAALVVYRPKVSKVKVNVSL
jgi:hypothetical protein